jgi:hypothetical protein
MAEDRDPTRRLPAPRLGSHVGLPTSRTKRRGGGAGPRWIALGAGLVLAVCVLLGQSAVATAAFPGANGRIAYSSEGDIFSMAADGSDQRNLTRTPDAYDFYPAWSPDGTRIAFVRDGNGVTGPSSVFVMNADGTNLVRLTSAGTAFA